MSDLRDAAALLTSLKTAFDLTKAFFDVQGAIKEQGKVFELQRVIISAQESAFAAQQAQAALLTQIDELKKRVAELETWDREKERYEPTEIASGVFAYTLKQKAENAGPDMRFCATCYNNRHISVLQRENRMPGRIHVEVCHHCKADLYLVGHRQIDQPRASNFRRPK